MTTIRRVAMLCVAGATLLPAQPRDTLRVGVVWPSDAELRRGISFGIDEARRSLALFRWTLVVDSIPADASARLAPGIAGLVAVDSAPQGGAAAAILLGCAPRAGAFVVAGCAADSLVEWHPGLERFGAAQLNDRYRAAMGTGMSAAAWKGWFAMKVLAETAVRARPATAARVAERLADQATAFDGHKGVALRFGERGLLLQPLYPATPHPVRGDQAREARSP